MWWSVSSLLFRAAISRSQRKPPRHDVRVQVAARRAPDQTESAERGSRCVVSAHNTHTHAAHSASPPHFCFFVGCCKKQKQKQPYADVFIFSRLRRVRHPTRCLRLFTTGGRRRRRRAASPIPSPQSPASRRVFLWRRWDGGRERALPPLFALFSLILTLSLSLTFFSLLPALFLHLILQRYRDAPRSTP